MIYLASPCPAFPPSATNSQTVAEYCTGEGKDRGQIQGTFPVRPETEVRQRFNQYPMSCLRISRPCVKFSEMVNNSTLKQSGES